MTASVSTPGHRLVGTPASARATHVAAGLTVAAILALAIMGFWLAPLAFLAVGAGAGYSLSGSV